MRFLFLILPAFSLILLFSSSLVSCNGVVTQDQIVDSIYLSYDHEKVPYTFYKPDSIYTLPLELTEVSGLTAMPDGTLAVIEDESGIIYQISTSGEILNSYEFGENADYEAIEYADGKYYAFESNGDFHQVVVSGDEVSSEKIETEFKKSNEIEGLALKDGQFLVAPKSKGEVKDFEAADKAVYLVSMDSAKIVDQALQINKDELEEFLKKRHPDITVMEFDPSGVAVDPVEGNIYLLSADMILVIFTPEGELLDVVLLELTSYRQPEGITFTSDGTLYICSEAAGDVPRLMKFSRK